MNIVITVINNKIIRMHPRDKLSNGQTKIFRSSL